METMKNNERILNFFRESYGQHYVGDQEFQERFIDKATQIVELQDSVALMNRDRITAVGTSIKCNRMVEMVTLLKECKVANENAYITIGTTHEAMKHSAREAGMVRSYDQVAVERMLDNTDDDENYFVTINVYGLVVFRPTRQGYYQEVYS